MKYDHSVKYNGRWYEPWEEIDEGADSTAPLPFEPQDKKYTKTEINVMPKSDLVNLAIEEGIAEAEGLNGSELKKLLIEKFGL